MFLCKYPLATNDLFRQFWQFPNVILMKRLHLFQHGILPSLTPSWSQPPYMWMEYSPVWPKAHRSQLYLKWAIRGYMDFFWFSQAPSCNRIMDLTHLWSLILNIFSIPSAIWSPSCVTSGENSNNTELCRVHGVASLFTRCDASLVCPLSTY